MAGKQAERMSSATADLTLLNLPATLAGGSLKRFVSGQCVATLILADCLDVLPIACDAVVTDPPYGHGWSGIKSTHTGGINRKGKRINTGNRRAEKIIGHDEPFDPAPLLAMDVTLILWGANHYASRLPDSPAWLVWDKRGGTAENNLSDCEQIGRAHV